MAEEQSVKLDRFAASVGDEVSKQVEEIQKQAEEKYSEAVKQSRDEAIKEAYEKISKAENALNAKYRREQALEEHRLRQEYLTKRQELKNKIFDNVKNKLTDFASTPEYKKYLFSALEQEDLTGGEILLSEKDMNFVSELKKRLGEKITVNFSTDIHLGGYYLSYDEKGIIIDNTLDGKLAEQSDIFSSKYSFERMVNSNE